MYVNARPTASMIIVRDGQFLALRRAVDPKAGQWELPGGFCDGWEHPTEAAVREAREELGVGIRLGDFLGMYVGQYDYQDELLPVLDCYFLAALDEGEINLAPAEATEYAWFPLADPPSLAFDTMNNALADLARITGLAAGRGGENLARTRDDVGRRV